MRRKEAKKTIRKRQNKKRYRKKGQSHNLENKPIFKSKRLLLSLLMLR